MNDAAFFDRDGTINVDKGYVYKVEDLEFIPGIPDLIRKYNSEGVLVIVITNQSGIARGLYDEHDLALFHEEMNRRRKMEFGAHIDAFYYCPHHPDITGVCDCRKPKDGLFRRAIKECNIDVKRSVSYGDSSRDRLASERAGVPTYYNVVSGLKDNSVILLKKE